MNLHRKIKLQCIVERIEVKWEQVANEYANATNDKHVRLKLPNRLTLLNVLTWLPSMIREIVFELLKILSYASKTGEISESILVNSFA